MNVQSRPTAPRFSPLLVRQAARKFILDPFSSPGVLPTDVLAVLIVLGIWTGLARALLGSPIFAAVLDLGLVILTALVGRHVFAMKPRLPILPVLLVSSYITLATVEILNPNVPSVIVGLEGFRKTAFTMVAFYVAAVTASRSPSGSGRFFRIVAIGSIPALVWAARQVAFPLPIDARIISTSGVSVVTFHAGEVLRAFAPTAGPFHLGILAVAVMVIGVVEARRPSTRWLLLATFAGVVLGFTLTRANLVAGVIALGLIAAFGSSLRDRLRTLRAAGVVVTAAVAAALLAGQVMGTLPVEAPSGSPPPATSAPSVSSSGVTGGSSVPLSSRPPSTPWPSIGQSGQATDVPGLLNDKNLQFRFAYWRSFIEAVAERPITGWGTSSAADGFDRHYANTNSRHFQPHSLYFKAALELGLGGLAILVAILVWMAVTSMRLLQKHRAVALITGGFVAAMSVTGVTGPMLDAYPVNLLFWSTAGIAAGLMARLRAVAP